MKSQLKKYRGKYISENVVDIKKIKFNEISTSFLFEASTA